MKVRCINASDCGDKLTVGKVYEVVSSKIVHRERRYDLICDRGFTSFFYAERFEPVTDEAEAPAEQPKVDPYEAHRVKYDEGDHADYYFRSQRNEDSFSDATARLHAGLESEKVREKVKAFPHPARNPR